MKLKIKVCTCRFNNVESAHSVSAQNKENNNACHIPGVTWRERETE